VIKSLNDKNRPFHQAAINVFALHYDQPLCISGDLEGGVFYCNYSTGEIGGLLATHADSVESIAFCKNPANNFCVSCGMDTNINIYNVRDQSLRQKVKAA